MLSEKQLQEIYQDTVRPLYQFISRRTSGDRELTEDLIQATFLRAVVDWQRNGVPSEPLAWLNTVARNLTVDHYRRERLEDRSAPRGSVLWSFDTGISLKDLIRKVLTLVRGDQRRLIRAFYFEGRTTREIAKDLKISERAVEGRLRRARRALRGRLSQILS
jgi:RNA polymerase sigma-70 factor, ECF subfamily